MSVIEIVKDLKSKDTRMAWAVAIAADSLQIVALPFFAAGGISPIDSAVDIVTAFILIRLIGWHWAFLPSLLAELVPGLDLFPTWTAAVFFVMRQRKIAGEQREIRSVTPEWGPFSSHGTPEKNRLPVKP
jgi:hypothetical protein